ncbi:hypothetical protein DV737_g4636, partial [Chaetothyriales sp. CBS 132003]
MSDRPLARPSQSVLEANGTVDAALQTVATPRPSISAGTDEGTANMADRQQGPAAGGHRPRPSVSRRRLVFFDPIAFRYLEEDASTMVLDRRRLLDGYELYVVEQWACSRTHPTFLVCTYTGDTAKSILVNVLSVPADQDAWSPRLRLYLDAVSQFHSKERETLYGTIMVTNLSSFPSALTVIPVPDGDVKRHREDLIVNEDLKRMGCTGRAAITLQPPQPSTVAKFHQLYHTSESAGLYAAVMELVKLCQAALVMYGKLEEAYVDGLLCDLTEKAIGDWWTDIGVYFYNTEPSDGVLGPTTVAAILGLFIGAYNRLKSFGAPVGKDILDGASMKRAIGSFQKAVKMQKTRRLDRDTLDRLHRATAKAASGEGWTVGKALKSTVSDVTGKGGEMVMGIVGRDKATISAAETLDMDQLAQVVVGPKMKWLWQGKSKPVDPVRAPSDGLDGRVFSTDDQGGFIWTSRSKGSGSEATTAAVDRVDTPDSGHATEGRTGFSSRIKDTARGLKPHARAQREGSTQADEADTHADANSAGETGRTTDRHNSLPLAMALALQQASAKAPGAARRATTASASASDLGSALSLGAYRDELRPRTQAESPRKRQIRSEIATMRKEFQAPVYQDFHAEFEYSGPRSRALRRSVSAFLPVRLPVSLDPDFPRQNRLNRQLSFSLVERSQKTAQPKTAQPKTAQPKTAQPKTAQPPLFHGPIDQMAEREARIVSLQQKARLILRLQQGLIPFAETKVADVDSLDESARQHLDELSSLYSERSEEYQTLRATSSDLVDRETAMLTEALRRVEVLASKLDYELNALQSRLQEVEDGIGEFERSVQVVEARVRELTQHADKADGWWKRLLGIVWPRK